MLSNDTVQFNMTLKSDSLISFKLFSNCFTSIGYLIQDNFSLMWSQETPHTTFLNMFCTSYIV